MPPVRSTTDTDEHIRLPAGGSFVITDEVGTELFRVTSTGDAVKVNKVTLDPATLDEVAALGGLTASVAELNLIDGSIAGTAVASKALVLGASKNVDVLAIAASGLAIGVGAGTAVTATAAELNTLASVTAGTVTAGKAVVATTGKVVDELDITLLKVGTVVKTDVVIGAAGGYKVARGELALDGSNPTSVAHGLTTCIAVTATLKGSAAPGASTSLVTAVINGANLDFYGWKPTGAALTELVASTGTESIYWIAVGT